MNFSSFKRCLNLIMTRNLAMQQTVVLIDAGYHSKIAKHFGNGKFLKHDVNQFAITLAKKQSLWCSAVYFYTAPPFQGVPPDPADVKNTRDIKVLFIS